MLKEKWSKGKHAGCVVSDVANPHGDNGGSDYYGGYLVAESIPKQEYVNLIAAAPDLLEACKIALELEGTISASYDPEEFCTMLRAAIAKAEGKEAQDG
jgi:hypothetical protein